MKVRKSIFFSERHLVRQRSSRRIADSTKRVVTRSRIIEHTQYSVRLPSTQITFVDEKCYVKIGSLLVALVAEHQFHLRDRDRGAVFKNCFDWKLAEGMLNDETSQRAVSSHLNDNNEQRLPTFLSRGARMSQDLLRGTP